MADVLTKLQRSRCMAAIKSKGNEQTELRLARILRAYRISGWRRQGNLPGKPDFVFREQRVAVFVDGCFWHGCRQHCRMPKTNAEFWAEKIARNIVRDRKRFRSLAQLGWTAVRLWEHELKHERRVVCKILSALRME